VDDPRLKTLQDLRDQAVAIRDSSQKLVAEITDQLQRSIFMHDDRGVAVLRPKPDRRRKPRQ
jgi:hypothetical protein